MYTWVHQVAHITQLSIRLAVVACLKVMDMAFWVDNKDFVEVNSDITVTNGICITVTKSAIEWIAIRREKVFDCLQTSNFKHLRFFLNYFSVEWTHQPIRTHYDRSFWQRVTCLIQTVDIFSCCIGLTDCSGCQIKDCVTIVVYFFQ